MSYTQKKLLCELLSIDSPTEDVEGVSTVQKIVARELNQLGFAVHWHQGEKQYAPLIEAIREGKSAKFITFICHADTVFSLKQVPFEQKDDQFFGAGVIDDKGGIVVGIEALRLFLHYFEDHEFSLRFVCSSNEEIGSIGFHDLFAKWGADSDFVFGLEPAINGNIVSSRNGNRWYELETIGKKAHAGRVGRSVRNAAHELCHQVTILSNLDFTCDHTSVHVGSMQAGDGKFNVVCGKAKAKIDVRFASREQRDQVHQTLLDTIETNHHKYGENNTSASFKIVDDCPPMEKNKRSTTFVEKYTSFIKETEAINIKGEHTGGAADISYFSTQNNICIDGLGPCGSGMHTMEESINIDSLASRSYALGKLLNYIEETVSISRHINYGNNQTNLQDYSRPDPSEHFRF